jgi:glycosyltransferase involved in cell wall biosynthesis
MKILMISPQPFFSPRGTPFSVYYRAQTLVRLGHSVDLVTYHLGRDVALPGVTIHRALRVPLINSIKIGPSVPKLFLDFVLFWKCMGLLFKNRYDAIHAHEEAIFFCLIFRLFFRKIIIYDMHSSLPQQLRNFAYAKNKLLVGAFDLLERASIKISDGVITICPELQQIVDEMKISTPSVMIENSLCNMIDFEDPGDDINDSLINWERFENKKMVVYTGTFEFYQGIPMVLESVKVVMEKSPNTVFVFLGGSPQQVSEMRKLAQSIGVKEHVVFTGNLHPNTVKRFIHKATILLSPRIRGSNTPLKIYEYLASGKPIVATHHRTHTQVISNGEAILTAVDAKSYGEGIADILNAPEKGEDLGRQARALYEGSYGPEIYESRLKNLFETAAKAKPLPS